MTFSDEFSNFSWETYTLLSFEFGFEGWEQLDKGRRRKFGKQFHELRRIVFRFGVFIYFPTTMNDSMTYVYLDMVL